MGEKEYITTSIPYVNGKPHLGHAYEFVLTDIVARAQKKKGLEVKVQSGTDDHAIKNVSSADANGQDIAEFVRANGDKFEKLLAELGVEVDEFLRTSSDARHKEGVKTLWEACSKDLYQKEYTGLYCQGCEQFYNFEELDNGACFEHKVPAIEVVENNWFFRLGKYKDEIKRRIETGELEIWPKERKNEILGFLQGEVNDLSVSRPKDRSKGWGIPVPGDDTQVVYVWFDALANYITGLGYGAAPSEEYEKWWESSDSRVHVIGKGILRFHTAYWCAFLLSAGINLPTKVIVHDYLTVDGDKIAKSGNAGADPSELVEEYGQDALRWWLCREVAAVGTTDFTVEKLENSYNQDLANTIGNLASRTLALESKGAETLQRWKNTPPSPGGAELLEAGSELGGKVAELLSGQNLKGACTEIVIFATKCNRFIEEEEPWLKLKPATAGDERAGQSFASTITVLREALGVLADELDCFVPLGSARLAAQLRGEISVGAFPRIDSKAKTKQVEKEKPAQGSSRAVSP